MIEMDVCFTKNRQPVLMHDVAVDRTTNGSGTVADLTLEEIKRLDAGSWKASQFQGEGVPTLREVLQIMPSNIWLIVHLRSGKELGERVAQTIIEQKRIHQALLGCNPEAATAALNVDSRMMVCMDRRLLDANIPAMIAGSKHVFLFRSKVDLAQETPELKVGNISIIYFDPDAIMPQDLPALFNAGVHFVVSPNVNVLVKAASRYGIRPWKPHYAAKGPSNGA